MQITSTEGITREAIINYDKPWIPQYGDWVYEDDK
jgi:hypothetical protein